VSTNIKQNSTPVMKKVVEQNIVRKSVPQINTTTKNQNQVSQNKKALSGESQNDIMKSILEDTARTTFKQMSKSDYEFNKSQLMEEYSVAPTSINMTTNKSKKQQLVHGDTAEDIVGNNDPKNLFGEEASSKWLKLAFTEKSSNNNYEE
jgi:hypothetical protein